MRSNRNPTARIQGVITTYSKKLQENMEKIPDSKIMGLEINEDNIKKFRNMVLNCHLDTHGKRVLLNRLIRYLRDRSGATKETLMHMAGYSERSIKDLAGTIVIEAVRDMGIDKEIFKKLGRIKNLLSGSGITDSLVGDVLKDAMTSMKYVSVTEDGECYVSANVPDHKTRLEAAKIVLDLNRLMPKQADNEKPTSTRIIIEKGAYAISEEWNKILHGKGNEPLPMEGETLKDD